jgi:fatty acid desaturase
MQRRQDYAEGAKWSPGASLIRGGRFGRNERSHSERLPKGYGFQPFEKPLLRKLCRTSLLVSSCVAASDWLWLAAAMCVGAAMFNHFGWAWAAAFNLCLLWPLCSRALRGFENLTHEGSHANFDRGSKRRNDSVVNWACSYWVLISVEMFWGPHEVHHKHFGSNEDPDKRRFDSLGMDEMPRHSPGLMVLYLLKVLPTYVLDYWKQFSNKKGQLQWSLGLHVLLAGFVSLTFYNYFWLLWLIYFWVPFLLYLPVHRFLAEAEEHHYKGATTEFGSTFSNLGKLQRWFLHPHGDAYHLLHHMLPQVPHWKMPTAHWLLATLDSTFNGGSIRKSIFDNPRRYIRVVARCVPTIGGEKDESTM